MARWSTSTVPASWCAPCGQPEYILWSKKDVTALKVLRDAKLVEARYDGILNPCRTPSSWPMRPAAWCWPTARPSSYSAIRAAPCAAWCWSI
jgi:hypothetical protein